MGWKPDDYGHGQIGPKFAGAKRGIMPDDVVLIARRHSRKPEIVGFGIVHGKHATRLKGFTSPQGQGFGSLRRLLPFKPWSRPPSGIPLKDVLRHTKALVQLHPEKDVAHEKVCNWMEHHLGNRDRKAGEKQRATAECKRRLGTTTPNIGLVDPPENHQLDYIIQTRRKVTRAKKIEAKLLDDYRDWLNKQDRKLSAAQYGTFRCDGYEKETRNLIEAKCSARREHIRMAVGQLLDYAFLGKQKFGEPNKAILLPKKPHPNIKKWLSSLEINIIWREGGSFFDDANGQFS
jgi:hypothetical protein